MEDSCDFVKEQQAKKWVVLQLWYLPVANKPSQKNESLCNSTKDLEIGRILLEISSNRKLVIMTTTL
jgi:hypothetical protein